MKWWFNEVRQPKRCMHIAYKRHPDFPHNRETRNRECLFEAGHDGPHLYQYPCDKSELCLARPHHPDCPSHEEENVGKKKHKSKPYKIPVCTKEWGCKADFHDPECLTYLEEQERREQHRLLNVAHNTSGGFAKRCPEYHLGKGRCTHGADHDDRPHSWCCQGCDDLDCPDCNDRQDAIGEAVAEDKVHALDCGCAWIVDHLEVTIGCPKGHRPGYVPEGRLVDEDGKLSTTVEFVSPHERDLGAGFPRCTCHWADEECLDDNHEPGCRCGKGRTPQGVHDIDCPFSSAQVIQRVHDQFKPGGQLSRAEVSHHTAGGIETIDFIYAKLGIDGGHDYVLGNILKYAARAKYKGQFESDIEKIRNYAVIMQEQERKRP